MTDITPLYTEITNAESMIKHLNEYKRMVTKQSEIEQLQATADELTRKIELARELPSEILKTAKIPIDGLTVENGIPLINGLPISNLSDGELLELCVDVTISKPGQLQIILIDGAERLDTASRTKLYDKCKEKGIQFIATRVDDGKKVLELQAEIHETQHEISTLTDDSDEKRKSELSERLEVLLEQLEKAKNVNELEVTEI